MGRQKLNKRNIRILQKSGSGSSYLVTLPIEVVRALEWQEDQKLVVERWGDGILIKDWEAES